jgi:hypothetical protein
MPGVADGRGRHHAWALLPLRNSCGDSIDLQRRLALLPAQKGAKRAAGAGWTGWRSGGNLARWVWVVPDCSSSFLLPACLAVSLTRSVWRIRSIYESPRRLGRGR